MKIIEFKASLVFVQWFLKHLVGGAHMLRHTGMLPKWVTFHQKFLDMGPILVKNKSLEEGSISQN